MDATSTVKKLLNWLATNDFECELLDGTEGEKEPVVIKYDNKDKSRSGFSVTGLSELPDINFQLDYGNQNLDISFQGINQEENKLEEYKSVIQSFLMLHPRVLLEIGLARSHDMAETRGGNIMIQYSIDDFNRYIQSKFEAKSLPGEYLDWLKENGSNERLALLYINKKGSKVTLLKMVQPDLVGRLPVTQQFSYERQTKKRK